jgi:hypothetical protein
MQRLNDIDNEIARCLNTIRDMTLLYTQSGNPSIGFAVEMVIRGLAQFHMEKMVILDSMNRENANPEYQRPMQLSELEVETPRTPIRVNPIQFAEMHSWDDEDEDEGPLQLADLMDTEPHSQIGTPDHVQYSQDGTVWTQNMDEDTDMDDHPLLHANVTVRQSYVRGLVRTNPGCGRKMVYSVDPEKLHAPCENACNVCFENPLMIDSCETSCKHLFCKACFVQWENTCQPEITCPTCRTEMPMVTEYRARPY